MIHPYSLALLPPLTGLSLSGLPIVGLSPLSSALGSPTVNPSAFNPSTPSPWIGPRVERVAIVLGADHPFAPWSLSCLPWIFKVNPAPPPLASYPQTLRIEATGSSYRLKTGYYALHYPTPQDEVRGAELVLEDGAIAIFKGEPPATAAPKVKLSAVYGLEPGATAAVPTGRVFVQFGGGEAAEAQRTNLQKLGFAIAEIPVYAPHAAWVEASSGQIVDAVTKVGSLQRLPNVDQVELQMLMESRRR